MLYKSLEILKEQLEDYFKELSLNKPVELQNIALWEQGGVEATKSLANKIILTLLRVEEESTLKNDPNYRAVDYHTEYQDQSVYLNLYVLVSANFNHYETSLQMLSKTIEFFHGKNVFTFKDTVYSRKLKLNLYSPTFEELNNIWGTLGGRQLPSAIFRVQFISIEQKNKLSP